MPPSAKAVLPDNTSKAAVIKGARLVDFSLELDLPHEAVFSETTTKVFLVLHQIVR